jgi:hypothetical protein
MYYVGMDYQDTVLFTDTMDTFDEAQAQADKFNSSGNQSVIGYASVWCHDEDGENFFWDKEHGVFIHEDEYSAQPASVVVKTESTADLTGMTITKYGRGYLLTPSDGNELAGTKYFMNGWWRSDKNAWFFKQEYIQDLLDIGAKMADESNITKQKDRTGLTSNRIHWRKLNRFGWALVPKKNFKHYEKETYRGGKWWKNGHAWFFTDNGRNKYISKYGSASTSSSASVTV